MASQSTDNDILEEAAEWQRQGAALRERLLAERATLAERLRIIDESLSALSNATNKAGANVGPARSNGVTALVHHVPKVKRTVSAYEVVRNILQANPQGLDASSTVKIVKEIRPRMGKAYVQACLYRLKKDGEANVTGEKGAWIYRLKEGADTA